MATVTGLTAERMLEIEGASVVDAEIVADHLILTKHNGEPIDAGVVKGAQGDVGPTGPAGAAGSSDPWVLSAVAWTFGAADAPTYTMTTPSDVTAQIGVGMRVRLTHGAAVKYFIVTAVAFSAGTTTVTMFGGTDYTLSASAITLVSFSSAKAPLGFPLNPLKWTVSLVDASDRSQSSPVGGTWYNAGSLSLSIPIGAWLVNYQACMQVTDTGNSINMSCTLSTANNSQSDAEMTSFVTGNQNESSMAYREKHLLLAAKTSYYLNISATAAYTNIQLLGTKSRTIIKAICAYL